MKRYHTILVRDATDAPWCIHMGFYDRADAKQERTDLAENGDYARRNTTIIATSDNQRMIDEAVAQVNAMAAAKHPCLIAV